MRYLVFATMGEALARNMAEATARQCQPPTIEWWQAIQHPADGRGALAIQDAGAFGAAPDGRGLGGLTPSEISSLQPQATLAADGWFPIQEGV